MHRFLNRVAYELAEILKMYIESLFDLDLNAQSDEVIFQRAKEANAVFITKDTDFLKLNKKYGVPPKII